MPARRFAHALRAPSAALSASSTDHSSNQQPAHPALHPAVTTVAITVVTLTLLVLTSLGAGSARAAAPRIGDPGSSGDTVQVSSSGATPTPSPEAQTTSSGSTTTSSGSTSTPARRLRMEERRLVTRGLRTHVRARLTRDGHPLRDVGVRFYRRAWGHRSWYYVGHARTNRNGRAVVPWIVRRSASWRARVPARDGRAAVTSNLQRDRARSVGSSAVRIAATRRGDPYSWGADGPNRFDCSGLTRWVFRHLGRSLPHNSAAQYGRVRHVARNHKRIGDLIFFHDGGGHIYHVAIYAGSGMMWHAPHSGTRVRKQRIYSGSYYVGRA